jgi:predicted metal-dependent peptidase
MTATLEERLIQSRLFLMRNSPFFATLLLNAPVIITDKIPTAATNGKNLLLNPEFMGNLTDPQLVGVLCHEVLHMAFSHVGRMDDLPDPPQKQAKQYFFNYAADIVVNGVVLTVSKLELPDGHIRNEDLEDKSLEEVYAELLKDPPFDIQEVNVCMLGGQGEGEDEQDGSGGGEGDDDSDGGSSSLSAEEGKALADHWQEVMERAKQAEQMGKGTSELLRKLNILAAESTIDYRQALAEWIVPASGSWGDYDRRFIYDEMYIDTDITDSLTLRVFIDTSGSVCKDTLSAFVYEVKDNIAISNWAKVNVEGYFFDTQTYGPYESLDELLEPKGFGGTDFDPIFETIEKGQGHGTEVNIIFTDGYANIPEAHANNIVWILGSADGSTRSVYDFVKNGWNNVYKFKRD